MFRSSLYPNASLGGVVFLHQPSDLYYPDPLSSFLPRRTLLHQQSHYPSSTNLDTFNPYTPALIRSYPYPSLTASHGFTDTLDAEVRYRRALEWARTAENEYAAHLAAQFEEQCRARELLTLQAEVEALRRERAREQLLLEQERRQLAEAERQRELRARAQVIQEARHREGLKQKKLSLMREVARQHAVREQLVQALAPQKDILQEVSVSPFQLHPVHSTSQYSGRDSFDSHSECRCRLGSCLGSDRVEQIPSPAPVANCELVEKVAESKPATEPGHLGLDAEDVAYFLQNLFGPQVVSTTPKEPTIAIPIPTPQDKGKGKAAPESQPKLWEQGAQRLLEERLQAEEDQEIQDTLKAILLSLQDQNPQNASGASSSKVRMDAPIVSGSEGANLKRSSGLAGIGAEKVKANYVAHRRASTEPAIIPSSPTTPYDRISRIRTSLHSLTTSFTFPSALDFDAAGSELAFTPANAPLRAYEHALNGLLAQLDAVDSDGDEEVRGMRKEVVVEVERELEKVEEEVGKRRPGSPTPSVPVPSTEAEAKVGGGANGVGVEVAGYNVEAQIAKPIAVVEGPPAHEDTNLPGAALAEASSQPAEIAHFFESSPEPAAPQDSAVPIETPNSSPPAAEGPDTSIALPPEDAEVQAVEQAKESEVSPADQRSDERPAMKFPAAATAAEDTTHDTTPSTAYSVEPTAATQGGELASAIGVSPAVTSNVDTLEPHSAPRPASPQPNSDSFLVSLAPVQFTFPLVHPNKDEDELEDSVIIDKEDSTVVDKEDSTSERSWDEIESNA
ncbi:hypothetical protein K488DRAFT_84853 [Vararia minispora EC-137]|uniref:Uncharacterized protein n=1 Tax=Vararia minispora EC-137 TaxID=1314806 RepID=A0ACB8QNS3_9AGAM|nr:hypothetical protein K488DRAFT_84853 [Vararia minispora EC-137]